MPSIRFLGRSGVVVGAAVGALIVWRTWDASQLDAHRWAAVGVFVVAVLLGVLLPQVRRELPVPGEVPALIALSLAAVYGCVPETDQVPPVAAAVAVFVAVELGAKRSMPEWAHGAMIAVVLWSGIYGATGRESALVGALFAMWPFVVVAATKGNARVTAIIGSVAAIVVARTGALQPTLQPAIIAVAIALPASFALAWVVSGQRRPHPLDGGT